MGEKKKKDASTKLWKKILIVGACVLFVVLMIVSGMGSGWLSIFTVVKPGDTVVIDYTFFNAEGNPILTTDQQLYVKTASTGSRLVLSRQISIAANQSLTRDRSIPCRYTQPTADGANSSQFSLRNIMRSVLRLVGMKLNDQKRHKYPFRLIP